MSQKTKNSFQIKFLHNTFFTNHLLIILLFVLLTGIFTFPSFFEFDKMIGVGGDIYIILNNFWWYNYNIEKNFDMFDFHWIFYHDYQFYPIGAPTGGAGTLNTLLSIPLVPFIDNLVHVYNIIVYASFIFTGYGMFHLGKHLTKSYFAAIIAGIIFAFGTYQLFHTLGHLNLLATQFIPFTVLFFLKTVESKNLKYPIIGGLFLFLSLISSLYLGFFMMIFITIFVFIIIIKREKLSSLIRFAILFVIGSSLSAIFYYGHLSVNKLGISVGAPIGEFVYYGSDLASFFLPTPLHNFSQILNIFPIIGDAETWSFLGYATIFLIIFAVLKTEKRKTGLWIISGILFALISMGPIFKFFDIFTYIPLPYYFLYNIPGFDIFRAIGRASLYVIFASSILAAYGVTEIFKLNFLSKNKKLLIIGIIGIIIFASSLGIPYPTKDFVPVPDYYYEIASDPRDIAILDVPLGRGPEPIRDETLFDDWQQYQIIHEKPYYGGHQSRVSGETQSYVRTYFFNQFIGGESPNDIISQDMQEVGISILNHYNIGYVVLHYPPYSFFDPYNPEVSKSWFPQTKSLLNDIFSKAPDYDDKIPSNGDNTSLIGYSVPKSDSKTPFVVLDDGWGDFRNNSRSFDGNAVIKIINPTDEIIKSSLDLELSSLIDNEILLTLDDVEINKFHVDETSSYHISTGVMNLMPGVNNFTISSKDILNPTIDSSPKQLFATPTHLRGEISGLVNKILINSDNTTNEIKILESDNISTTILLIEFEINKLYLEILERPADQGGLNSAPNVLEGRITFEQIKHGLINSEEYDTLQLKKNPLSFFTN